MTELIRSADCFSQGSTAHVTPPQGQAFFLPVATNLIALCSHVMLCKHNVHDTTLFCISLLPHLGAP